MDRVKWVRKRSSQEWENLCCYSASKSYPTLWNPMGSSLPDVPSLSLRISSDSCPYCWWCYLTISSSADHFSFYLQSFPALGHFWKSQLFESGGERMKEHWKITNFSKRRSWNCLGYKCRKHFWQNSTPIYDGCMGKRGQAVGSERIFFNLPNEGCHIWRNPL